MDGRTAGTVTATCAAAYLRVIRTESGIGCSLRRRME